jgi:hypothetical protein
MKKYDNDLDFNIKILILPIGYITIILIYGYNKFYYLFSKKSFPIMNKYIYHTIIAILIICLLVIFNCINV